MNLFNQTYRYNRQNLLMFTLVTFLGFFILLIFTGLAISLKAPVIIQDSMKNICAWSPTLSIIILFKRLYPDTTFRQYWRSNFRVKTQLITFLKGSIVLLSVFIISTIAYLVINEKSISSLEFIKIQNVLPVLLLAITSGATGEELGWRGFLLKEFQKKYSLLVSSLTVGFIWGIWHFPLWLLSGFTGMDLLLYIITFMTSILSISVIMSYYYTLEGNILIAMWIHFLFNFLLKLVQIDILQLLGYVSIFISIGAIILIAYKRKMFFRHVIPV